MLKDANDQANRCQLSTPQRYGQGVGKGIVEFCRYNNGIPLALRKKVGKNCGCVKPFVKKVVLYTVSASRNNHLPPVTLQTSALAKTISDEQILELLRSEQNFEHGFRLLMRQYKERLYWHIRRIVLVHDDADDVLQNTFIKVYKGILQFEGKSKLYTWLYRIATNEALTFLQNQSKQLTSSLEGEIGTVLSNKLRADTWFDGDAIQQQLQIAIAHLPDKQRVVFNLRYYEEMPYEEMAQMLDTSVGALKASFHHAVKKVTATMEGEN